jgi:hypothetical protein
MTVDNIEFRYIAWVTTDNLDFDLSSETTAFLDDTSGDTAHLYIIPNTSISGPLYSDGRQVMPDDMHYGYQDTLDCKLYNASYTVSFNFTYPIQSVSIQEKRLLDLVPASQDISQWVSTGDTRQAQQICYQSLMG